ncbi:unnamed protein product [Brachionus calyciflorus]|uniref:PLAT domain-containing protein n=1 Tax=Brachionus calyciflorus TaxID=104777 RepID=A0A814D800_9BILA|nr:unnamed protein product [Brachionus calyciflorus]
MIYKLTRNDHNLFHSSSSNSYLINEFNSLGQIRSIRFYISESQKSRKAADWFLRHVIVHDLTEEKENYFIIYKWVCSDPNLTCTIEEFNCSEKYDVKSFGHLFIESFGRLLIDMCPWLSVYFPKYYSDIPRYAKCQLMLFLLVCFTLMNNYSIQRRFYAKLFKISSNKFDQLIMLSSIIALFSVLISIVLWILLRYFYHQSWIYEQNSKYLKSNLNELINKNSYSKFIFDQTFEKLADEIRIIKFRSPRKTLDDTDIKKPSFKINGQEFNTENDDNADLNDDFRVKEMAEIKCMALNRSDILEEIL